MLIIKSVTITQDGEEYTTPETPIPQSAVCVVHDGANYTVYEHNDDLPVAGETPPPTEPQP